MHGAGSSPAREQAGHTEPRDHEVGCAFVEERPERAIPVSFPRPAARIWSDGKLGAGKHEVVPPIAEGRGLEVEKRSSRLGRQLPQHRSENECGNPQADPQRRREPEKAVPEKTRQVRMPAPAGGDEPPAEGEEALHGDRSG